MLNSLGQSHNSRFFDSPREIKENTFQEKDDSSISAAEEV